jgi:hypothetical protein
MHLYFYKIEFGGSHSVTHSLVSQTHVKIYYILDNYASDGDIDIREK